MHRLYQLLAIFAGVLLLVVQGPKTQAQNRLLQRESAVRVLLPFDYQGVTLNDGPLRRQFDEIRFDYLRIPTDALLKGFRQRAGLPAPGGDLGGWYSSDVFHVFGQIMSGLARMYAATGDPACKARAEMLLHEWSICIAPDGYFFYSKHPNAPHYIYEKTVGGLVDMIQYCGSAEAASSLAKITRWAETHLGKNRGYAFNAGDGDTEWYTLSENLYRAYLVTGDVRYRDFARVWEYTEYWDIYGRKQSIFDVRPNGQNTQGYHAYSHVNTLSGLGAGYLVTGDRQYIDRLSNAYDWLNTNECFATGGYGPNELLAPRGVLTKLLGETHNTFETQCGSWAGFKVCKYLISCTGDARYGDWIEKLVINGIGASISMSPEGRVFYYSDYNTRGASKRNIGEPWTCCTGTRPMAAADFHDLIYFHSDRELLVNLFTPSTLRWKVQNSSVRVEQKTKFPEAPFTHFTITTERPCSFTLSFRTPGWLSGAMTAEINGKACALASNGMHRASIMRKWRTGDTVEVNLPMQTHIERFNSATAWPAAVMVGPVAMAFDTSKGSHELNQLTTGGKMAFLTDGAGPLDVRLVGAKTTPLRPFYSFGPGERYLLYIDPDSPERIPYADMQFSDGWNDSGGFRFINRVGATATATIEIPASGGGFRWIGYRFDDGGRAEVKVDGQSVGVVDQYGPGRDLPFDYRVHGLKRGKHTIEITLLAEKSTESKDRFLNVAGIEIIHP